MILKDALQILKVVANGFVTDGPQNILYISTVLKLAECMTRTDRCCEVTGGIICSNVEFVIAKQLWELK